MADRHMSDLVEEIICYSNNPDGVEQILKRDLSSLNNIDSTYRKPIFYCVDTFEKKHKDYILEENVKKWPRLVRIADMLLRYGAELTLDDSGWTLLHEAARHGDYPLIQLLLRRGMECICDTKRGGQFPAELAFSNNNKKCAILIDKYSLSLKRQCRYAILKLGLGLKIDKLDIPSNLKLFLNYQNPYNGFKWSLTPIRPFLDMDIANGNVATHLVVEFIGNYASNGFVERNADVLCAANPKVEVLIQLMNQLYATGEFQEVCYDEPLPRPPRYSMEEIPKVEGLSL